MIRRIIRFFYRLTMPKILKRAEICASSAPRTAVLKVDDTVLSFCGQDEEIFAQLKASKEKLFEGFEKGQKVLIKINLNTALPYPASTDPKMLGVLLDMLLDLGITDILVGDCSSVATLPTRKNFKKAGLLPVLKNRAKMVCFEKEQWLAVSVEGEYLKKVVVPEAVFKADRIIYLANLKTHKHADFSMSMKLAVGFMHPHQRFDLHREFIKEKTAELLLAIQPDLIFLDAREPFITGGPNEGDTARGNCVFAGTDPLSVDLAGYKLLYQLKKENGCLESFTENPFEMKQFEQAAKILGEGGRP